MKRILHTIAIFLGATLVLASCDDTSTQPIEPPVTKQMSVSFNGTELTLPYNSAKSVTYSVSNASGTPKVTVSGLPEGITSSAKGDATGGEVSFLSVLDEEKTITAKITVADNKTTVSKDITLHTEKKPQSFSVNLDAETVTLMAGSPSQLTYSTAAAAGDVTVTLQDVPKSIWIENAYDKAKGTGALTFSTSLEDETTQNATLVFNDTKTSINKTVSIHVLTLTKAPGDPEVNTDNNVIYPAGTGVVTEFTFTVPCGSAIDEISISSTSGINAELQTSQDKKSGKVKVSAKSGMTGSETFTLKAKNSAGESSKTVTVVKAVLELSSSSTEVTFQETSGSFQVNTNLEYTVKSEEEFISASRNSGTVSFTVKENPYWTARTGKITVSDSRDILKKTFTVTQAMTTGSHASDLEALMAIYESLNMKEWTEMGSFQYKIANWGTDARPDYWAGTRWSASQGNGRCNGLGFAGPQPNSTGIFPEELGHLTELIELDIRIELHAPLPNSIKNLLKLKYINCWGTIELPMALDDWTGLKELVLNKANKLREINFESCNLYGPVPEWVGEGEIAWCLAHNHFSGQIPDKVANNAKLNERIWVIDTPNTPGGAEYTNSQFDPSKYEISSDGWTYYVTGIEKLIYTQKDNYALWIGERPTNTKFVNDEHGGHWEWTD